MCYTGKCPYETPMGGCTLNVRKFEAYPADAGCVVADMEAEKARLIKEQIERLQLIYKVCQIKVPKTEYQDDQFVIDEGFYIYWDGDRGKWVVEALVVESNYPHEPDWHDHVELAAADNFDDAVTSLIHKQIEDALNNFFEAEAMADTDKEPF